MGPSGMKKAKDNKNKKSNRYVVNMEGQELIIKLPPKALGPDGKPMRAPKLYSKFAKYSI